MLFRVLSPFSPRSLTFRLIASFSGILLVIFSLGNAITLHLTKHQLYQDRDAQILEQRAASRADIEQAEQRLIEDLNTELAILTGSVEGPLRSQVSLIHTFSQEVEDYVVEQFTDCLTGTTTSSIYHCLRMRSHHFSIDTIRMVNRMMIKTLVELLLSREELVAVEVLDWDDHLFVGYTLDQQGALSPLSERFAARPGRALHRMEQPVVAEDYLGRVIFHYHTDTIDALSRKAEDSIAQFIDYSNASVLKTIAQITRTRILEGAIFFGISLTAIFLITLIGIIHPLRQLTRHAETIAKGDWQFIDTCDKSAQRHDELGILVRSFNLMSETIRASHQQLHEINTQLEHKVVERTRELEEKNRELQRLSTTDQLTQVSNRVGLEAQFLDQLYRAQRYDMALSVLLCDVDFFKRINDTYGHQVGDVVLVEIAALLSQTARASDCVGRWGGEEFVLILPETPLESALIFAERLCAAIAAHPFPDGPERVTISMGVSSYRQDDTQDTLIERADKALYRAKEEGRNRVITEDGARD